jgi:hypothetical protein
MPPDPAHQLNPLECQADFTYTMVLNVTKIQDIGKGDKSVADDLEAVLGKIESCHQGSIAGYRIMHASGLRRRLGWSAVGRPARNISRNPRAR